MSTTDPGRGVLVRIRAVLPSLRPAQRRVADAVVAARRIDIYGIGASGFVGQDLHQKLHRIGLLAFSWPDPHAALTSAALLDAECVAIAISHTGTTLDTVDALRAARESGAR